MPTRSQRRLARLFTATILTGVLAAALVTAWPSSTAHPPERIVLTGRAVPINPTALPAALAPTTTTTIEPTATPPPVSLPTPKSGRPDPEPAPPPAWSSGVFEAIAAHFGGVLYDQAVGVARCESTLNASAIGGNNFGLFQISSVHADDWATVIGRDFSSSWNDADANAAYARHLYDEQGWGPWACRWAAN